jgi:MFS family permease
MDAEISGEPKSAEQSPFAYRSFRHYWVARVCSMGAYQMQVVATGWSVYEMTNDPLDLGWIGLVQFVPRVALTLWAGGVADRYDRRAIAVLCTLTQMIACAMLTLGSWSGVLSRETIFGLIAIIGSARAFEMPTMQSLLPSLLPTSIFPRGLTLSTAATQLAIIGGPALAGLTFLAGVTAVYLAASVLFATAALMMFTLPRLAKAVSSASSSQSLLAGVHFIAAHPVILGAISLDLFAVLLGGATAMLPVYAKDILRVGPSGLSLLQAAPALGALAMTLLLWRNPIRRRVGIYLFLSVAIFGVGTIAFALSTSFGLSLGLLVLMGAADCVSVVIRQSLVQLETPDHMRGRVSAVNSIFIGASNQLGEFESGVMAAAFGTVPSVVLGGAGTLLITALWIRLFPSLIQREQL